MEMKVYRGCIVIIRINRTRFYFETATLYCLLNIYIR